MHVDVLIVGGGHGGAQLAITLRQLGFPGSIAILTEETHPPYQRPPLSKDYFSGEKSFERILIRPAAFWTDQHIDLQLGCRVVGIDASAHHVMLRDAKRVSYGTLVWAAGGRPRPLPCLSQDYPAVHFVRTRDDVDELTSQLAGMERIIVVGGGYIGLESAAALAKFGKKVMLVEALERVLARVAGEPISRFYEAEHRAHGVDVQTSLAIQAVGGGSGSSLDVAFSNGSRASADLMIVGIGILPNIEPLAAAGAICSNGVHVDGYCRTSLPDVFAIGDCAAHENRFARDARIRLESVQNAVDQANVVAHVLTGKAETYAAIPWFWSNQYDLRLQTIGLSAGYDDLVVRGDPASRSFSVAYLHNSRIIALDAVNLARDFVQAKALITDRVVIDKAKLADHSIALKSLSVAATADDAPLLLSP
jgi:3-phenylpropionate/trans-cinnamate dioxygenase ferredoxin reductase component